MRRWSATTSRPSSRTWRSACTTAAADLEFETAARLRDEIKRLRDTELAVADDPLARQADVEDKAGAFKGETQVRPQRQPPACRSRAISSIATEYEPVQPTYAQSDGAAGCRPSRTKPSLDDMGPGTDRAIPRRDEASIPARAPQVDSRTKAGAFGEGVRGPHKPTLDEMGPHASLPVKGAPPRPTRTIDVPTEAEKKGRRGRPRKTGRPGQ